MRRQLEFVWLLLLCHLRGLLFRPPSLLPRHLLKCPHLAPLSVHQATRLHMVKTLGTVFKTSNSSTCNINTPNHCHPISLHAQVSQRKHGSVPVPIPHPRGIPLGQTRRVGKGVIPAQRSSLVRHPLTFPPTPHPLIHRGGASLRRRGWEVGHFPPTRLFHWM